MDTNHVKNHFQFSYFRERALTSAQFTSQTSANSWRGPGARTSTRSSTRRQEPLPARVHTSSSLNQELRFMQAPLAAASPPHQPWPLLLARMHVTCEYSSVLPGNWKGFSKHTHAALRRQGHSRTHHDRTYQSWQPPQPLGGFRHTACTWTTPQCLLCCECHHNL